MGVNKERVPGNGGAFFLHTTDGGPTAGCVAIDDGTLVEIMRWLQPGALIAVTHDRRSTIQRRTRRPSGFHLEVGNGVGGHVHFVGALVTRWR